MDESKQCLYSAIPKRMIIVLYNGINGRLLGLFVAADLPGKIHCSRSCAHAQNFVNNGNLPGNSAAT